jgi:hypothetical protein
MFDAGNRVYVIAGFRSHHLLPFSLSADVQISLQSILPTDTATRGVNENAPRRPVIALFMQTPLQ